MGHEGWVGGVAFSGDGKLLASASYDHTIRLWDATTGKLRTSFAGHPAIAFSHKAPFLVMGGDGITFYRVSDGARLRLRVVATSGGPRALVHTPGGVFAGDEATFDSVMFRLGPDLRSAEMLTAEQAMVFHRPTLAADFFAGRDVGTNVTQDEPR